MPTVEERISAVEGKVDAIADLKVMVGEFRAEMFRQFTEVDRRFTEVRSDLDRRFTEGRSDIDRRFTAIDRRIEVLDQRMERHFMWMVGIQFTVLIAVIVALIQTSAR